MGRRSTLTGAWSGAHAYPSRYPETVFEADIEEANGGFSGRTREPDILSEGGGIVTATLEGTRRGNEVSFIKFMDGSGGMRHTVRFHGTVNEALTRIEGTWIIPGDWSGTFFMERTDPNEEEAIELEAEVKV